jgi:hypothetical protein
MMDQQEAHDTLRAEGRAVKIARPQTPGQDFNDLWRARGSAAP